MADTECLTSSFPEQGNKTRHSPCWRSQLGKPGFVGEEKLVLDVTVVGPMTPLYVTLDTIQSDPVASSKRVKSASISTLALSHVSPGI